jgi:hypothetical protein
MNVNKQHKVIWWLPTRTASRSVSEILAHYNFYNSLLNLPVSQSYTHSIGIPKDCQDYTIVCNIRNPYAKVLSTWHLRCFKQDEKTGDLVLDMPFSEFVAKHVSVNSEEHEILRQSRKPDIYIRMENMVEDLKQLSFIDFNDPTVVTIMESWIKKNWYTSEGCMENSRHDFDLRRDSNNPVMTDYKSYYTQKELDIVWKVYENVFNEFGYSREFI